MTALTATGAAAAPQGGTRSPTVEVLSSRADAVSGGDALVRVAAPRGVDVRDVRVRLDGRDVTGEFTAGDGQLLAVLDGLDPGRHTVTAEAPRGRPGAVRITAHPGTGPVFSGPHEEPFACETEEFRTATGEALGAPLDADCSVGTRVDHVYRTTAGAFAPLPDPRALPADVAWTRTLDGVRVPYVVRVQTGTVNRGVYEFAALADPREADADEPSALAGESAWNQRVVYTFGGGCRGGWYRQGTATGGVLDDAMLSRGFAVVSNSLNVFGNDCNDLLAAETLSTTREEFIETYGVPRYTMGWGCSGGSYQAHQAADAYPGLLDGIVVGCSFPDVGLATSQNLADSRLLHHYFAVTDPSALTPEQELAVSGFAVPNAVASQSEGAKRLDPQAEFDPSLPVEQRYDPQTNPRGARATVWDHTRNAYGTDPATGFARRPLDNVGVQYGLQALRDGVIDVDEFLDLNDRVGGLDVDARVVADRMDADPAARRAGYETGRFLDGGGGLADVPIIDYRAYTDDEPAGDIHQRYHSFSTRERLVEADGDAGNQVMLTESDRYGLFSTASPVLVGALEQMDRWILAARADRRRDRHAAVVAARPADLTDACFTAGGERIAEAQVFRGDTRCNALYPSSSSPRLVAGGPLASDVVTCRLRPPARGDYPATSEQQWQRLNRVFERGVCDYSVPGVDETGMPGTWAFFTAPGRWTFHEPAHEHARWRRPRG